MSFYFKKRDIRLFVLRSTGVWEYRSSDTCFENAKCQDNIKDVRDKKSK